MSPHLLPDPQHSSVRQTAPPVFPPAGIALVLGAGGARGLAHIGVLQALDELRIPVRAVVGASIGALIGGWYAAGWSADEMRERLLDMVRAYRARVFFPFPWGGGLLGNWGIRALLEELFAHAAFENLRLPFLAVATDLRTGERIVIDQGTVWSAVRASISMPTLLAPYRWQSRRYVVDAAVVDPVPVDVAQERFPWPIVAVRVQVPPSTRRFLARSWRFRSPWSWFWVGRFANEITIWELSESRLRETPPALCLDPIAEDPGCFGYARSSTLVETARAYTMAHADTLRAIAGVDTG